MAESQASKLLKICPIVKNLIPLINDAGYTKNEVNSYFEMMIDALELNNEFDNPEFISESLTPMIEKIKTSKDFNKFDNALQHICDSDAEKFRNPEECINYVLSVFSNKKNPAEQPTSTEQEQKPLDNQDQNTTIDDTKSAPEPQDSNSLSIDDILKGLDTDNIFDESEPSKQLPNQQVNSVTPEKAPSKQPPVEQTTPQETTTQTSNKKGRNLLNKDKQINQQTAEVNLPNEGFVFNKSTQNSDPIDILINEETQANNYKISDEGLKFIHQNYSSKKKGKSSLDAANGNALNDARYVIKGIINYEKIFAEKFTKKDDLDIANSLSRISPSVADKYKNALPDKNEKKLFKKSLKTQHKIIFDEKLPLYLSLYHSSPNHQTFQASISNTRHRNGIQVEQPPKQDTPNKTNSKPIAQEIPNTNQQQSQQQAQQQAMPEIPSIDDLEQALETNEPINEPITNNSNPIEQKNSETKFDEFFNTQDTDQVQNAYGIPDLHALLNRSKTVKITEEQFGNVWTKSDAALNNVDDNTKKNAALTCINAIANNDLAKYELKNILTLTNSKENIAINIEPLVSSKDVLKMHPTYIFIGSIKNELASIKMNASDAIAKIKSENGNSVMFSAPNESYENIVTTLGNATEHNCNANSDILVMYDKYILDNKLKTIAEWLYNKINPLMDSGKHKDAIKAYKQWIKATQIANCTSIKELPEPIKQWFITLNTPPTETDIKNFMLKTNTATSVNNVSEPIAKNTSEPSISDIDIDTEPLPNNTSNTASDIGDGDDIPTATDETESDTPTQEPNQEIYDLIKEYAITPNQIRVASSIVDEIFTHPGMYPDEYEKLSNFSEKSMPTIYKIIDTASPKLGHRVKYTNNSGKSNTIFSKPLSTSSTISNINTGLIVPEGFNAGFDPNIWDKPVINAFGYPFINYSSTAIHNLLHSPDKNVKKREYNHLKSMLREALIGNHGGFFSLFHKPIKLLKAFAEDNGINIEPNVLKVNSEDLIGLQNGETISVNPIKYYSSSAEFEKPVTLTKEYLATFYTVLDFSNKDSISDDYLKYTSGMTRKQFVEATEQNNGIPPFYIMFVPTNKSTRFKKTEYTKFNNVMVKTRFNGHAGGFIMPSEDADRLFHEVG